MSEAEQDSEREPSTWLVWVVPSLGAVVLLGAWVWLRFYVETKAHEDYAAVGDALAPIVGLFTAIALGAALRSVALQRHELRLQRRELQLARDEARQSREAQQAMAEETRRANDLQEQSNALAAVNGAIALLNAQVSMLDAARATLGGEGLRALANVQKIGVPQFANTNQMDNIGPLAEFWQRALQLTDELDRIRRKK